MQEDKLWNLNQLLEHYPAFKEHGIRWQIRLRKIPIVRIGRRIYFDPMEINRWIEGNKIHETEGK